MEIDLRMARQLFHLPWHEPARPVVLRAKWAGRVKGGPAIRNVKIAYQGFLEDLLQQGCRRDVLEKLLHIAAGEETVDPGTVMRGRVKRVAVAMRKLAKEIEELEQTGFLYVDEIRRREEDESEEAALSVPNRSHELPAHLDKRAGHYQEWLGKGLRARSDLFEALPSLLVGLYVLYVSGFSQPYAVVPLLNCLQHPKRKTGRDGIVRDKDGDTYRREIDRFLKACPRTWKEVERRFQVLHPLEYRDVIMEMAAEWKAAGNKSAKPVSEYMRTLRNPSGL